MPLSLDTDAIEVVNYNCSYRNHVEQISNYSVVCLEIIIPILHHLKNIKT